MGDANQETTLEGHHFVVLGWDDPGVMADVERAGMKRGSWEFQKDAKKMLVKAVIALGHYAEGGLTTRAALPQHGGLHDRARERQHVRGGRRAALHGLRLRERRHPASPPMGRAASAGGHGSEGDGDHRGGGSRGETVPAASSGLSVLPSDDPRLPKA